MRLHAERRERTVCFAKPCYRGIRFVRSGRTLKNGVLAHLGKNTLEKPGVISGSESFRTS